VGNARPLEARGHVSMVRLKTGGQTLAVTLATSADGADATVDDAVHRLTGVTATHVASIAGATVEALDVVVDGRPRQVVIARTRDRIHVAFDGHAWVFERVDDTAGGAGGGAGSGTVTAPMPGKVVKVLVAAGDAVTAGQPLVVVEAMKMETTLAAEIDGTVKSVNANAGDTVDAGAVLVEIAPA
jgi:acetyl/propionyl-CoA carboxylase alpha subunit